jgi:hypothetical protein
VLRWSPIKWRKAEALRDRIMRELGIGEWHVEDMSNVLGDRAVGVHYRRPLRIDEINQKWRPLMRSKRTQAAVRPLTVDQGTAIPTDRRSTTVTPGTWTETIGVAISNGDCVAQWRADERGQARTPPLNDVGRRG